MKFYDNFVVVNLCHGSLSHHCLLQLSFSPTTPRSSHIKLLGLLVVLMVCSGAMLGICVVAGFRFGPTIFAFMAAEVSLQG